MNESIIDWLHPLSNDDLAMQGPAHLRACTKIFPNQPNPFRERRFIRSATARRWMGLEQQKILTAWQNINNRVADEKPGSESRPVAASPIS